jgi:hypothetical protein
MGVSNVADRPVEAGALAAGATVSQPLLALAKANRVRLAGAALRRELKRLSYGESRARVASLLESPPAPVLSLRLGHLLRACPGLGPVGASRIARRAGVRPGAETMAVRRLVGRERMRLAAALRHQAKRYEAAGAAARE